MGDSYKDYSYRWGTYPNLYQFIKEEHTLPTEPKKYLVANSKILNRAGAVISGTFNSAIEAEAKAKELARQYKGESYTVFQTKKTFRVTDPVEEVIHI